MYISLKQLHAFDVFKLYQTQHDSSFAASIEAIVFLLICDGFKLQEWSIEAYSFRFIYSYH